MLPKASAYVKKNYNEKSKRMYFLIGNDEFLERYNTIWDKVTADVKRQ